MSIRQQGGVFGRNPKFNDVEVESLDVNGAATIGDDLNVGNGVLFVDKSTGRVGVNTSTPDQILTTKAVTVDTYHNIKTDKASGTSGVILANDAWTWVLRNNGGNSNAFELRNATSGQQELTVTTAGNFSIARGNLAFASGKGIDFSATSGTGTSELFDDYEEGTWTPTFRGAVTLPTIDYAQYTKIGRVCFYELRLTIPVTTDGAAFEWSLPFTRASTSGGDGACITYSNKDATYNHSVGAGFSNVYHRIYSKSGASLTYLNYSSSTLSVSGSFIAA